jgi:hypothetical protein
VRGALLARGITTRLLVRAPAVGILRDISRQAQP